MRLEMGRVDHEPLGLAGFACPLRENLVEHAKTAPAHEPIIDRLVRPVVAGRIAQAQPILDDEDNPLMTRRSSTLGMPRDKGEKWLNTTQLRLGEQKQAIHGDAPMHRQ